MKQASKPYTRLPGLGHTFGGSTRLYLASDHLLQVSSATFTERYKRFYFRDIQTLILLRTQVWIWWIALSAILTLLLALSALMVGNAVGGSIIGTIGALCLGLTIVSIVRGPSCRCYIRTAVQMEVVPSLNRMKLAGKVLAILEPRIQSAQGGWPAEPVRAVEQPSAEPPKETDSPPAEGSEASEDVRFMPRDEPSPGGDTPPAS